MKPMQSKTTISHEDMSGFLTSFFGFEVRVFFMTTNEVYNPLIVEWSKVET